MPEDQWIEITPDGPYVLHGDIPLLEMAPVHTFNGEPIDWHTLREIPVRGERVELCRCGQSRNKPFCDSSHETNGFDGTETADRRPYLDRARIAGDATVAVADDRPLCFAAGFCNTRTTGVSKLIEVASDDPDSFELMRDMIFRCPSGRLTLIQQRREAEPDLPPSVAILPGGPIWVRGGIPVVSSDGTPLEVRNRVTFCRCGRSFNKPYCDGTHIRLHFDER